MNKSTWKANVTTPWFSVSAEGSATKPTRKGTPSFKLALLMLVAIAVMVALGTAAIADSSRGFPTVATVWTEIKPIVVLLLETLRRPA